MTLDRRPCAFPPHPTETGEDHQEIPAALVTDCAARRLARWLRHAPAERLPLPAIPAVWTAAEILHLASVPGLYPGAATLAAAGLAYGAGERRARGSGHPRLAGAEVAAVTGAAGAWVTAAAIAGPLAGPDHLLSLAYLAGAGGWYWWLRRHQAVQAARARRDEAARWRERKAAWHRLAALLGLRGSHLLGYEDTLLGDSMLIDTRGTGKRASQISARDVAERLGEIELIPAGRIDVTTDAIPGRLRITVRRTDPWAAPVMHPAATGKLDASSPYARYTPYPASIRQPLTVGIDPETGRPLQVALWDKRGGKVVQITAKKDGGKTTLLDSLTERITACPDAVLLQINLSKALEDGWWAPLAAASALDRELASARRILAFVHDVIRERPRAGRSTRVHQPTSAEPLFVVKIDEFDAVSSDPVCRQLLEKIDSKCRSEGVALVKAGQRATAAWSGGGAAQANTDIAIWGKFARSRERGHVAGREADLPDMGAYGESHSGVFAVTELPYTGHHDKGRTFYWGEEAPGLQALVAHRAAGRRPYTLEPALARLAGAWAKITTGSGGNEDEGLEMEDAGTAAGAGGELIPDAGPIRAKAGTARALTATDPLIPAIPAGMAEHAARLLADRQRQALANNFGDVTIPGTVASALLALLAAPEGTTSSQAAEVIGKSKPAAHRYLSALRASGVARLDGSGRSARFRIADSGGQRPALSVVPPPDDDGGEEEPGTAAGHAQ